MLVISAPTSFTSSYLAQLHALNDQFRHRGGRVAEIYGSFQSGLFHSARPAKYLPAVSREQFMRHVMRARAMGISFNYLLNAPSYANMEYTHEGRIQLEELLQFLVDAGVASVTVAVPYLVEVISSRFPALDVVVSTIGYVNAIAGLQQYAEAGAARIVLDVEVNRDFPFLEQAARQSSAELEVVANPVCISHCHFKYNHYCVASTGAQSHLYGGAGRPYNQYYLNWCFLKKLRDPAEFLKSPWIRPEDLSLWTDVGIRYFKVAGRGQDEAALVRLCRSYLAGHYSGNLLELLGWPHWRAFRDNPDGSRLADLEVVLDNDRLEGFLDYFAGKKPNCRLGCDRCGHCPAWARRALTVSDSGLLAGYIANMQANIRELVTSVPDRQESAREHARWQDMAARQEVRE